MKIAYADPPYIGQAHRYVEKTEVDHQALVEKLCAEFPDGWALSLSSPSLKQILAMCPDDVRVAAWVKPFAVFKPNVNPAYAWEPVIFRGGRKHRSRDEATVVDWVSANITLERGMVGAKPDEFCYWMFQVMGLCADDEFIDLYLGSGSVTRAWEQYRKQQAMPL